MQQQPRSLPILVSAAQIVVCLAILTTTIGAPSLFAQDTPTASAPSSTKATRIAVYELVVTNVEPELANIVLDSLLIEIRKLKGVSVIGMNEVRLMLDHESQKQLTGCADESCLADIAGALGVDELITGNLSAIGDEHIFGLRRINQLEAKIKGSISRRLTRKDGEEFLAAVGPAVAELFPEYELREGTTRGVDDEVALRLNPPPLPVWAFASVVGTSVVAASLALVTTTAWAISYSSFFSEVNSPKTQTYADLNRLMNVANISLGLSAGLFGTSILLAVGAGSLAPLTDFGGYGAAQEAE